MMEMGAEPDEKTEAAIDDFRFLVLFYKKEQRPVRLISQFLFLQGFKEFL